MGAGKGKARREQTAVNPALFRLRVFEAEWVAPLLDEPDSELRSLLLAEAKHWLELGQQIGYFEVEPEDARADGRFGSADTEPYPSLMTGEVVQLPAHHGRLEVLPAHELEALPPHELEVLFNTATQDRPSLTDFQHGLSEAMEDLRPERREFLELVFFASEEEWAARLQQATTLTAELVDVPASELVDSPKAIFSEETLNNVDWLLEGPDSEIEYEALPAGWRAEDLSALTAQRPFAQARLDAVEKVRGEVLAAVISSLEQA